MTQKTPIRAPRSPGTDQLSAAIRQLGLIIGGYFVSRGTIEQETLEVVIGAAVILVPFIWGQLKVRRRAKEVSTLAGMVPDYVATRGRR